MTSQFGNLCTHTVPCSKQRHHPPDHMKAAGRFVSIGEYIMYYIEVGVRRTSLPNLNVFLWIFVVALSFQVLFW